MPIQVHCPNPACAKVHWVKDKYAGQRGKCPACTHWMYVSIPEPKAADSAGDYVEDVGKSMMLGEQIPLPQKPRQQPVDATPATAAPAQAPEAPEAPKAQEPAPKRRFNWAAAALVLLGVLGLGAVAAAPYLERPATGATGALGKVLEGKQPKGIDPQYTPIVTAAAGSLAAACLLSLMLWRLGFLSRSLLYLATIGSAVLLFVGVAVLRSEMEVFQAFLHTVDQVKGSGVAGEAAPWLGPQLYAAVGGAAAACLFLLLGVLVFHRHWWSRMLAFIVLGAIIAFGPVWAYREELGIKGQFPPEWENYLPF
jgi:hypothetical protein